MKTDIDDLIARLQSVPDDPLHKRLWAVDIETMREAAAAMKAKP